MALVLEIEHLLGVAFAAQGPDSADPDWPPQPDRVFSALVAAWAARGGRPDERAALEWLERQGVPEIAASPAHHRPAPISFVPPNDKLTTKPNPHWRMRQPRRFPAALPLNPTMRLVWPEVEEAPSSVLDAVARDVAHVGHSASLTRCRFRLEPPPPGDRQPARRRIYAGRLAQLEAAFAADRRPTPGDPVAMPRPVSMPPTNGFSGDWLALEVTAGALDLRAAPLAARILRDAVMSGYGRAGLVVPEWVSGHRLDGAPTDRPHLAIVPMAFAGFPHADGALMGFALVPPAEQGSLLDDEGFRTALSRVMEVGPDGRRTIAVGRTGLRVAPSLESEFASLDPARYRRAARVWGTVTPLVLPRHLKSGDAAEIAALIRLACTHACLPQPEVAVAHKHSAVDGVPAASPGARAPRWIGWRVPDTLASRRLTHAVLRFAEPVAGPVLIGAGRFVGLGLCLPLDREAAP
jgi:CRISPR-associated protein Csb2